MKKIIITGHNGFLGTNIVKQLSNKFEIIGISTVDQNTEIFQIKRDVRKISLNEIPKDVFCIIHLAAITDVKYCEENPHECFDVNFNGTLNMLEISRKLKSKFIYFSTSHVYGLPKKLPITEEHPENPTSIYSASKLSGEIICKAYSKAYDLDISILRLFSVYGPNSPVHQVINRIISQLLSQKVIELGNLHSKRDFIYVDDVIRAFEICLETVKGLNTYNIGSEKSYSILEICELLKQIAGKEFEIKSISSKTRQNDPQEIISDSKKIKKLNWEPQIGLKKGLELTYNWFKDKQKSENY